MKSRDPKTHPKIVPAFSFNFLTPFFDTLVGLMGYGTELKRKVLDLLEVESGDSVVDVGCGTGVLLILAAEKFSSAKLIGIDADKKVLDIAKRKIAQRGLNIELQESSAAAIPYASGSIDVAVSTLTFHHLPTDVKTAALAEIYRILKPGAKFLLADFGKAKKWYVKVLYIMGIIFRVPETITIKDNLDGKLPGYMRAAGFSVSEVGRPYRGFTTCSV